MSAGCRHWCETCEGRGTIDQTLGGEWNSNPKAECPDCEGHGYWAPNARPDGGPAFPTLPEHGFNTGEPGMTLRDHFAGQELAKVDGAAICDIPSSYARVADHCYRMADAMLKARST